MKTILLSLALLLATSKGSDDTKVYVCDSSKAVAYHSSKECRGLQKCVHDIVEMKEQDAKDKGLRPCKICY